MCGTHTTGARLQWSKKDMMILIMNTGRFEHELDGILVSRGPNKDIINYFYNRNAVMIGWLIGNVIWWVGLIVVVMWLVQKCAI